MRRRRNRRRNRTRREALSPERQEMADRFRRQARESMARRRGRASRMKKPGWKQQQQGNRAGIGDGYIRRPDGGYTSRTFNTAMGPSKMVFGWQDVENNRKRGISAEDSIRSNQRWQQRLARRDERRRNSPRWQRMKKRNTTSARDLIDSGRARANPLWTNEAIAGHQELNKKRRAAWKLGERHQPEGNMRGTLANEDPRGRHLPSNVTNFSHLLDPKKLQAYRNRRKRRWGHM